MPVDVKTAMQSIGQYDLIDKVAEGGMGTVYKGRHRLTGETVAVKVVPPHIASNPVYFKRFEQEYNVARALDHPNIVRALDFGRDDGVPFLVMEFVEGESLGQRIDREQRLTEAEAIRIAAQIAQGLDKAHALGLIHRDVKPDNILLTAGGLAKLTDMGLVKEIEADLNLTRTGRGLGTPHFMAPEQFRNAKHADARCDIYSLAATFYMAVTGELPFQSAGPLDAWMKKVKNDIVPALQLAPDLSQRADWAIRRAMSPDPTQRPETCREFIEDLTGQSDLAQAADADDLAVTVASLWHVLYRDPEGVVHTTCESTEGLRIALQDGSLGSVAELRLARRTQGPFEPPRNFPEFRDLALAAQAVAAVAVPQHMPTPPSSNPLRTAPVPATTAGPAGPLIDLGVGQSSYDWLAWLTLLSLGITAAVIGYLLLPGVRWRWFQLNAAPPRLRLSCRCRAEIGKDLRGSVGVLDRIESGVAHKFVGQHRHGQPLKADRGDRPLLGEVMRQPRFIIAFDAADHRVIGFVHSRRLGGAHLRRPGHRRDVQHALAWLVRHALGENVFEIGAGLGQVRQLLCHAAGLVFQLACPNVYAIPFEAHDRFLCLNCRDRGSGIIAAAAWKYKEQFSKASWHGMIFSQTGIRIANRWGQGMRPLHFPFGGTDHGQGR
jgi:eukaryotic-like serine/threonine-protein kinase